MRRNINVYILLTVYTSPDCHSVIWVAIERIRKDYALMVVQVLYAFRGEPPTKIEWKQ